ncbi:DoxX family protein [Deinococcus altitudinis]|uniref:DoxX family protein n=1 Tax=Deinococcus altitudinis TaxID=468914 RepID=UPI003892C48F
MIQINRVPYTPARHWAVLIPAVRAPLGLTLTGRLELLEIRVVSWLAHHAVAALRVSLGLVFFWFGVLKFFPGVSAAEALATHTISVLTFGLMPAQVSLPVLAAWECAIGLGLISGRYLRFVLVLLFAQMAGTFLPLAFFPHETFKAFPFVPNLEGQYIIKNLVLVSTGMVVGATSRGGRIIQDARAARLAEQTRTQGRRPGVRLYR